MNSGIEAPWLLAVVSGIYLWIAWSYYKVGSPGMALAFVAYALANVGFIWATLQAFPGR